MATENYSLTNTWQLVASANTEFLLNAINDAKGKPFLVATSDTETEPSIVFGHPVYSEEHEAVTRSDIGPGYVYAKVIGGADVQVAVTAWASS